MPLERIAAVTFTEKAGSELRDRLRVAFDPSTVPADAPAEGNGRVDPAERTARAERALEAIDSAAIGTLHSFAQRILTLHPVEANLPPLIEVLDEVASSVAFDERWSVLQRELLDEPALADAVLLALSAGVTFEHLRSLARAFGSDWDLIEDRVLPFPPPVAVPPNITELLTAATSLSARADECTDAGDKFLARMQELATWVAVLGKSATPGEMQAALTAAGELKWGHGRQQNWPDLGGLKASCQEQAVARRAAAAAAVANAALRPLAYWIAANVRESAQLRADEGRLDFHDLLVLARRVLRSNADVRAALHEHVWPCLAHVYREPTRQLLYGQGIHFLGGNAMATIESVDGILLRLPG